MAKFKTIQASQITLSDLMLPSYSNFSGKIHGGHILNLMDQVAFACASRHSGHYCVTASVNRVDFLHPVEVGEILHLKASVNFTGKTSMVIGMRVESENIQNGRIHHCNSSYFTMVAKNEKGENVTVPGLILDSSEAVRRYVRSIKRMAQTREREATFKDETFNARDYIDLLANYNVDLRIS